MYRSERNCIKHLGSRLFIFRTWIIRQRNTVWVHKLADIVTSLWLGIIVLPKELFNVIYIWELLNNIIIGINELYVCKYLLDLDLTLMNVWRDNYFLENDYDSKTKLSIIFSIPYIRILSLYRDHSVLTRINSLYPFLLFLFMPLAYVM